MSGARRALFSLLLAAITVGATPIAHAQSENEAELWRRIVAERDRIPTGDYPAAFDDQIRQCESLLAAIRKYQTLFPGGARRSEANAMELQTLFDLGALRGGAFDELCKRAGELEGSPREEDAAEAAYWLILCRRVEYANRAEPPSSQPVGPRDTALIQEYRAFILRFPRSRHTPRLSKAVFDADDRKGDLTSLRAIAAAMNDAFSDHPITLELLGRLRRRDALGERFEFELATDDGTVDNERFRDHPLLIVCWSADDAASRRTLADVETYRKLHAELAVVGVEMDVRRQQHALDAAAAGISWPQARDGRGPANAFSLQWGVTAAPFVFVLDSQHRLLFSGFDRWREAADRATARR